MEESSRATVKMTPLARPARTPTLAERYDLRTVLGAGGMATVYLAFDERLERLVAVKMMTAELAVDRDLVARFYREAIMLASIESPYIVPVYDVATAEVPYLVMRYVEGRTIAQELDENTRMDPRRAGHTVQEVLRGLLVLHQRRLLHRDLKPANVMRQVSGQIVLLDLGVARDLKRQMLTRPGMIMGTPEYMSPEQADPEGHVDERSDIYQAGWLLAHLLVGSSVKPSLDDLQYTHRGLAGVVRVATGPLADRYCSVREMIEAIGHSY